MKPRSGKGRSPKKGELVTVHYTGWLTSGEKFDSSVDRDEPFQFVLGEGQVIGGWDLGVAQMKIGDKVKLTIPPHLGYGAGGYPAPFRRTPSSCSTSSCSPLDNLEGPAPAGRGSAGAEPSIL